MNTAQRNRAESELYNQLDNIHEEIKNYESNHWGEEFEKDEDYQDLLEIRDDIRSQLNAF